MDQPRNNVGIGREGKRIGSKLDRSGLDSDNDAETTVLRIRCLREVARSSSDAFLLILVARGQLIDRERKYIHI